MKSSGIFRAIDGLGRVVIPKEIRDSLNIDNRDLFEICVENNSIVLQKKESLCVMCKTSENLVDFDDKKICVECIKKINSLAE